MVLAATPTLAPKAMREENGEVSATSAEAIALSLQNTCQGLTYWMSKLPSQLGPSALGTQLQKLSSDPVFCSIWKVPPKYSSRGW